MGFIASALNALFDVLLAPWRRVPPFLSLLALSLVTGFLLLLVFRFTSNQQGLSSTRRRIRAHLLGIRLFHHDLGVLVTAMKDLLACNLRYFLYALRPLSVMIIPVMVLLSQLQGWYGHRPLEPGESAILSVTLEEELSAPFPEISIQGGPDILVQTPALRLPDSAQVQWRLRAAGNGEHRLAVLFRGRSFEKTIRVSDRFQRVCPQRAAGAWTAIRYPGERPLPAAAAVRRIEIRYPVRAFSLFGLKLHWLLLFSALSILSGLAFSKVLGVQL